MCEPDCSFYYREIMPVPSSEPEAHAESAIGILGAPGRNRTCDLPLRRRLLYPLSYRGKLWKKLWWSRGGSNP